VAADSSPFGIRSFELASVILDMICDLSNIYDQGKRRIIPDDQMIADQTKGSLNGTRGEITVSSGIIVGLAQVNRSLSLIYLTNAENVKGRKNQLTHNLSIAKDALLKLAMKQTPL